MITATSLHLLPEPTSVSRPFWEGLQRGRVVLQRCRGCHYHVFYPRSHCPHCLSPDLAWKEISGLATLHTYTVPRDEPASGIVAIVELDVGPRLTTNLVGIPETDIRIGMRLKPVFKSVSSEITLLCFTGLQAF